MLRPGLRFIYNGVSKEPDETKKSSPKSPITIQLQVDPFCSARFNAKMNPWPILAEASDVVIRPGKLMVTQRFFHGFLSNKGQANKSETSTTTCRHDRIMTAIKWLINFLTHKRFPGTQLAKKRHMIQRPSYSLPFLSSDLYIVTTWSIHFGQMTTEGLASKALRSERNRRT